MIIGLLALIFILVIGIYLIQKWNFNNEASMQELQATYEHEQFLTNNHGEEVIDAIENYVIKSNSLAAIQDPSILLEIAVPPYTDLFLNSAPEDGKICSDQECLIVESAEVNGIRVLEYTNERFKAIGCITFNYDKLSPQGEFIRSLEPLHTRSIYVFISVEGSWKLAGIFDITIPKDALRDWDYAPDWLRQIIGELPADNFDCTP